LRDSTLPQLLIDTLVRRKLDEHRVRKLCLATGVTLHNIDLPFIAAWLAQTPYKLWFTTTFDMSPGLMATIALVLFLEARDSRLIPCQVTNLTNISYAPGVFLERVLSHFNDAQVETLTRFLIGNNRSYYDQLNTPKPTEALPPLTDRINYRSCVTPAIWRRMQHNRFVEGALVLIGCALPVYPIVWILDWLISDDDVKHVKKVRTVEALWVRYRRRAAASAPDTVAVPRNM
jgi:hypothetical protein